MTIARWIRVGVAVATFAAVPGCKSGSEPEARAPAPQTSSQPTDEPDEPEVTPADDPAPVEPSPAEQVLETPDATDEVTWIGVVSSDEPPGAADELVVDDTAISLNGERVLELEAGRLPDAALGAGSQGQVVTALAAALDDGAARTVLLVTDAQVPYRTLHLVLETIKASNRTGVSIAGLEADTVGARDQVAGAGQAPMRVLPLSLPRPKPAPAPGQAPSEPRPLTDCGELLAEPPVGPDGQPVAPATGEPGRVLRAHLDTQGFVLTIDGRRLESLQDCPAAGCAWDRYYDALLEAREQLLPETGCIEIVATESTPMQRVVQIADITRVQLGQHPESQLAPPGSAEALETARPLLDETGARRYLFPHIVFGAPEQALPAGQ